MTKKEYALNLISEAYDKAIKKHGSMQSGHEGYAVIKEEFEELWDEIKKQQVDNDLMQKEAAQLGAMALRFLVDICL